MQLVRRLLPVIVGVGLIPLAAGPALAAAPANDEPGGATVLTLPQTVNEDTTQATEGPDDAGYNSFCGAPATEASVWFTYTPASDGGILLDVSQSDFEAGLMVFDGTPATDGSNLDTCGPGAVGLDAQAGTTYYIMAFSDTPGVIGGNLALSLSSAPNPTASATLSTKGKAFHGGAAILHGSYKCTHDDFGSELDVHLFQRSGRQKIQSDNFSLVQCDGKKHSWSVRMVSDTGYYAKGKAKAKIALISCGVVKCAVARDKSAVKLSWASGRTKAWMKQPTHLSKNPPHTPLMKKPYSKLPKGGVWRVNS